MPKKEIEYFIDENSCWICISHKPTTHGYFEISRHGNRQRLHRYMYEKYVGKIPDNYVIRHTCDNSKCINPEHLLIGTHADNVADRVSRDRSAMGIIHGKAKLSEEDVINIYTDSKSTHATLASRYNVTQDTIRHIRHNVTWLSVTKNININSKYNPGHFSKLDKDDVEKIYLDTTSSRADLANKYNISITQVRRIQNDQRWISITKNLSRY